MSRSVPLVVDLDGTLITADSLHELIVRALRRPIVLYRAVTAMLFRGKAAMKASLAQELSLDFTIMPTNQAVLETIKEAHESGRPVVLATGADTKIAQSVMEAFPLISTFFASDGQTNLTSTRKAEELLKAYGASGFDYIGNSVTDVPVWNVSRSQYLAVTGTSTPRVLRSQNFTGVLRGNRRNPVSAWTQAIRPHQSLKNLLLFLPLIASHNLGDVPLLLRAAAGVVLFSVMAASVYLLNDALDLDSDRRHHKKSRRALAAGEVSPLIAIIVAFVLAVIALACGRILDPLFGGILLLYACVTIAYSFYLKRVALVDVLVLAGLYMIRIIAGAQLTGISLTFWFVAVTTFLFLSLALAKRFTEVVGHQQKQEKIHGRGYEKSDSLILCALGVGSGIASVVFLAMYLQTQDVETLYRTPGLLWFAVPLFFYWLANLWIQAGRNEIHEDPVLFAMRNRASLISGFMIVAIFTLAALPVFHSLLSMPAMQP